MDGRGRARQRRDARHAGGERGLADAIAVPTRSAALGEVDDEVAAAAPDQVDDRRLLPGLAHLADALDGQAGGGEREGRAVGRDQREAEAGERGGHGNDGRLVGVADREERRPAGGQWPAGGPLRLRERGREVGRRRHHLTGRAHLGAEHRIAAGEAREREHGRLHAHLCRRPLGRKRQVGEPLAGREPAGGGDEVDPDCLARERHRARGSRVRLEHEDLAVDDRELDVEKPDDAERAAQPADDLHHLERLQRRERRRRQDTRGVARVDARLLHVLHHRRDVGVRAVGECVDVELDRVLEEVVDEDAPACIGHCSADVLRPVADAHRTAAEHVRGPHEHRVADVGGDPDGLVGVACHPPRRAGDREPFEQGAEPLAVLGEVDRLEGRAEDAVAGRLDLAREAAGASGRRTGSRRRAAAPARARREAPRRAAARSRAGRRCRSRSRPSRGCS